MRGADALRRAPAIVLAMLALAGCNLLKPKPPPVAPSVHFVIGEPYRVDGLWFYPRPQFDLDETGLAVATSRLSGLTADGELADPASLAAAHPTLQLPALARVTNLATGRQVLVRVNDRGPARRGRIIALTPRALILLGAAADTPALRVRVQVVEPESRMMAAELQVAEAPPLPIAAAPAGEVKAETLAPPPGVAQAPPRPVQGTPQPRTVAAGRATAAGPVPLRLPELVWQVTPHPGALFVELAAFSRLKAAEEMQRRFPGLGAQLSTSYDAPRESAFRVRIGPLADVAAADAALARAIAAGVADPRILVE